MTESMDYDIFISYSRRDDADGWVSALREAIYDDFKSFCTEPFRIFLDRSEIRSRQDWELRLHQGLRSARVLLVCLSPNYLKSAYCRWEWEEFARLQARRIGGGDAITGVYFVELGGDDQYSQEIAAWRRQVERVQLEQLQPWFPDGVAALQQAEVRRRVKELGQGVYEHWRQARLAKQAPGNLIHHNPNFVGRVEELAQLRAQLSGGAVGVVTAVHGIGGMGKTELALTYAHAYAASYQGGTWYVDADAQTDLLEAVASLARSPALGLEVSDEDRRDSRLLGQLVLAHLKKRTEAALEEDEATGACFLLLDNVSEPQLLSEAQLAVLPAEPWFHVAATTRLGVGDIGAVGARGSVALVEVDRLSTDDAVALLREHQPARDSAGLHPNFSSPQQTAAARQLVELLDGYTLAVEQAAVYLGGFGIEPSQLLSLLQEQGLTVLDQAGGVDKVAGAIRHKEKLATTIVDQTLKRLPQRAISALEFASLLPPDTIPWQWLEQLTEPPDGSAPAGLPGLSEDDWAATRRLLEGRRLLTPADDPARFARLHRVLHAQLRTRPRNGQTDQRLDTYLRHESQSLQDAATPDTALLAVTAVALTARLDEGRWELVDVGLGLIEQVARRLHLAEAHSLAAVTLATYERLASEDPDNNEYQRGISVSLRWAGDLLATRGDPDGAMHHYRRSLRVAEQLTAADPADTRYQRTLAGSLDRMGGQLAARGQPEGALDHYSRSLEIRERLSAAEPDNAKYQRELSATLNRVGDLLAERGDRSDAPKYYTRSLRIAERLTATEPGNPLYQRQLYLNLLRVGDLLATSGDRSGARDHYCHSVRIAERLMADDPDNTQYQREVSFSLDRVGSLLAAGDDLSGALDHHSRSLAIREQLAAADPDNTHYQRELSASLERVGDLFAATGDPGDALDHYSRSLDIREWLATADPDNTHYQRELSASLYRVGSLLEACGEIEGAIDHYRRCLHISERLSASDPTHTGYQRDVYVGAYKLGSVLEPEDDPSAADYWTTAHQALTALDAAGHLSNEDRPFLECLTQKLGSK